MTHFGVATYGAGLLAGVLSTLSPCVLPIVPILVGSASAAHPRAPWALAAGLALSYAMVGTAVAWGGMAIGIDESTFRTIGAILLGVLGSVLISTGLQQRFASATAAIGSAGNDVIGRISLDGIGGQFVIGLSLGIVWSPCVGPTLGAAIVLASEGTYLAQSALLMGVFGLGAALPVILIAQLSRAALAKYRGRLMTAGQTGKTIMGLIMIMISLLILTGADRPLEAWLVSISPEWLVRLTTAY